MTDETTETETEKTDDKDGFGILHRNEFFNITPFTGWSFVYAAKKRVEIIGWYLVIFVFLTITVVEIYQLFEHHASKPTKTTVLHRSKTNEIFLPNITIELTLLLDFNHLPMSLYLNPATPRSKDNAMMSLNIRLIYDYLCRYIHGPRTENHDDIRSLMNFESQRILELQKQSISTIVKKDYEQRDTSISNPMVLKEWMSKISESKERLTNHLESAFSASDQLNKEEFIEQLNSLTDGVQQQHNNDTFFKLLLFEGWKGDPTSVVNEVYNINQIPPLDDIFMDAMSNIKRMIYIETLPKPEVCAVFDWSFDIVDHFYSTVTKVRLVPKAHTKSIKLSLYSFTNLWLKTIFDAFELSLANHKQATKLLFCDFYDEPTLQEQIDKFKFSWFLANKDGAMDLQFGPNKRHTSAKKSTKQVINLIPLIRFKSQIDNCHNVTVDGCMDTCLVKEYLGQCHCLPYYIAYLRSSSTICEAPCKSSDQLEHTCFKECSEKQNDACDFVFISETSQKDTPRDIEQSEDVESVLEIKIPEVHSFAEFIKEYEMTTEALFSRLGGTLELYSGINIMGAVHMLVFIMVMVSERLISFKTTSQDDPIDAASVEQEFQESISQLENSKPRSFGSWLYTNRFYEQTPMSGYLYIATADTRSEKLLWYMVIVCFVIVGSINIHDTYKHYAARPTQTTLIPTASSQGFSTPNLTLDVGIPSLELGVFKLSTRYTRSRKYSLAELWNLYDREPARTLWDVPESLHKELLQSFEKPFKLFASAPKYKDSRSFSSPQIFNRWQKSLLTRSGPEVGFPTSQKV